MQTPKNKELAELASSFATVNEFNNATPAARNRGGNRGGAQGYFGKAYYIDDDDRCERCPDMASISPQRPGTPNHHQQPSYLADIAKVKQMDLAAHAESI